MMLDSWSKMNISWIMLSLPLSFCFDHHHSCSPRSHPLSPLHWPHSPLPHAHNIEPLVLIISYPFFFSINFFFFEESAAAHSSGGLPPWWCGWVIWITIHMSNPKDHWPWPMANPSRHQRLLFPNLDLNFTSPHPQIYRMNLHSTTYVMKPAVFILFYE